MRALIVPTLIGALSAYLCRPLLSEARRWRIPHKLAVLILLGVFMLAIGRVIGEARSFLTNESALVVLRVRGQYKVNERYRHYKPSLPKWILVEAEPLVKDLNHRLSLSKRETGVFAEAMKSIDPGLSSRFESYRAENEKTMRRLRLEERRELRRTGKKAKPANDVEESGEENSFLLSAFGILSLWIVMPFVFVFLLFDQGQLLKSLVSMVPNRYFEVTLTVIHQVDKALGAYLRGVTLECGLVGLTFVVCLWLCGIDLRVCLAIGAIAGAANAIPFLGPAIGLVIGASYGLIAEEISPILPFVTLDNLLVGVLVTVAIAQTLDNVYFQPIVLGKAVDLQPLLVIFGVMGGSMLFGMAGMLLAIPLIVVVKVVVTTLFKELRAYSLI
jgi:predicted PurR-regulated permease PerM